MLLCMYTCVQVFVLDDKYMDTLTKYIAPDQIPQAMGGTCACDGDPECRSKYANQLLNAPTVGARMLHSRRKEHVVPLFPCRIKPGGAVPSFYRSRPPTTDETVDIPNRKSIVSHVLLEAGGKLKWSFKVPHHRTRAT